MSDHEDELQARVLELEGRVAALEARLGAEEPEAAAPGVEGADGAVGADTASTASTSSVPGTPGTPEAEPVESGPAASPYPSLVHLVDKIGIALLLLGVGFLLKYSYDQGWLNETIRVFLGVLTGGTLLAAGFHQRDDNRALSAVLNGGAIATFYGTIYAAFELYELVPATMALGLTIGVTMLGFVLAVRQEQPAIGSIATIGGFATPFLMEGGPAATPLAIFAMIVLAGATAIYLFKGWKSLLTTAVVGGICVLGIAADDAGGSFETVVTLSALTMWTLVAAAVPAVRSQWFDGRFEGLESFFAVAAPMITLPIFYDLTDDATVWTAVATACFGLGAYALSLMVRASRTFLLIAVILGVMTFGTLIGVEPVGLAAAGAAVAYAWLGERASPWLLLPSFVLTAAVCAAGFVLSIEESGELFATSASLYLIFVVATLVANGAGLKHRFARWFSWYAASAAGMMVVASQFESVGAGLVTGLWGAFALVALVAGFARDNGPLQGLGITAVIVTSGKLLFFDLESVDTLVRVGLFMAMGIAMLFVSYLVPRWQESLEAAKPDA